MRKNRLISLLFVAVMALSTAAGTGTAQAAGNAQVMITASPGQLSAAGTVELLISVTNTSSSSAMEDVSITGPGVNEVLTSIPPGDTQDLYIDGYTVSESMIGKPIMFTVSYTMSGNPQTATGSVTIGRLVVPPNVDLERTSDVSVQEIGKPVVFTYTVYNNGMNAITNVIVHEKFTDEALNAPFSLDSGEQKQITYTHVMEENMVSRPSVSFNSNGKSYINTIDVLYIMVPEESMVVEVYASKVEVKPEEEITVHCRVTNQIGQKVRDITVVDELGQVLGDPFSLGKGQYTTISSTFKLTADRNFSVTASGYDNNGNKIEATSEPVKMILLGGKTQDDILSITAAPSITELDEPGTVTFSVTISNKSENTLTDVLVSEQTRGDIATFDALATGDKLVSKDFEVTGDETFVFSVSAKDAEGNKYVVSSQEVKILVGDRQTATPAVTAAAAAAAGGLSTFLMIVIIIVALIVIAAIVLIIMLLQEKKAKKLEAQNPPVMETGSVQTDAGEDTVLNDDTSFIPPEIDDAEPEPETAEEQPELSEQEPEPDKTKRIDDIENPVE